MDLKILIFQRFYLACSRQIRRIESIRRSVIFNHFSETLTGTSSIRAYRSQKKFIRDSDRYVDECQAAYFAQVEANRWIGTGLDSLGIIVVLVTVILAVTYKDTISPGIAGLSITYALQVTQNVQLAVRIAAELETHIVSLERIEEYMNCPQEAPYEMADYKPSTSWPDYGRVQFEDYSTRYREGLPPVLNEVTCEVLPAEKIGIVGRTGAGKSSMTLALFRIIEATKGHIKIDNLDISRMGLYDLRSKLTIIPQDPIVFSGSLRMNLDPYNKYPDKEIWNALQHAHLKEFILKQADGLQFECTDGGENLSVGQRQLVCLARALLRNTKILVLDEATAAVDLETDDLIQSTIRSEFKDSTVITIAHRLNTILDYDRIIVLDKGRVLECESPERLLQIKEGAFHSMAKDAGII